MKINYILIALIVFLSAGCSIQMPSNESKTIDNRPQLTFIVEDESKVAGYTVAIDGLEAISISPYLNGESALRILPGTHLIEIYLDGNLVSSQKIYVGDGVTKEVLVQ